MISSPDGFALGRVRGLFWSDQAQRITSYFRNAAGRGGAAVVVREALPRILSESSLEQARRRLRRSTGRAGDRAGRAAPSVARNAAATGPAYVVLAGISFSHFLNDTMQSLIASVYPILKDSYALDFAQIGMITLAFQFTASLLQPVIGHFTDKKAQPFSLAIGMGFTFFGLLLLSVAQRYPVILVAASLVGLGSAVFHPESARIARLASGGRYGFAQSVFQLGGSFGTSMGPLLAALIVVPFGQPSIAWFSSIAFLAIVILWRIGQWYKPQITARKAGADPCASGRAELAPRHDRARGAGGAVVLQAALRVEPVELLHLLSDRQVRRLDPGGPVLSLHLPRLERGGGVLRRTAGRSLRPQICDLVFDPRRAAVHAGAALCRPVRPARC